jgi:hypothetical protein
MGACLSSSSAATAEKPAAEEKPVVENKPSPQIFAILRNGHEVIRGSFADLNEALDKGDMDAAKSIFEKNKKWEIIHMQMEEGTDRDSDESPTGFFKYVQRETRLSLRHASSYPALLIIQQNSRQQLCPHCHKRGLVQSSPRS